MTLNLLQTSRANPKLSAHADIFGIHDFNQCPLAPHSTKVIVNEKTDNCRSWYPYGTDVRYIGPSMDHYRCVQFLMPAISTSLNLDTLNLFPAAIPFPKIEAEYNLRQ